MAVFKAFSDLAAWVKERHRQRQQRRTYQSSRMIQVTAWLRNKFGAGPEPPPLPLPPDLPVLPMRNERPITPNLSKVAISQSPFFQVLPLEIRLKIFTAAFGDQTIHMDLRYDWPDLRGNDHAGLKYSGWVFRDTDNEKRDWRWWSSVCHRHWLMDGCYDDCRSGGGRTMCHAWAGEMPEKCLIGVMGCLLSCRQA